VFCVQCAMVDGLDVLVFRSAGVLTCPSSLTASQLCLYLGRLVC